MIVHPEKLKVFMHRHCIVGDTLFTNGCFDILHAGHVKLLHWARKRYPSAPFVVALNTDASIRRLKGPARPLQRLEDRACIMDALDSVDIVTWFGEDTPEEIIRLVKPKILLKGGDNRTVKVPGAEYVRSYGGKLVLGPYLRGRSTTGIEEAIRGKN